MPTNGNGRGNRIHDLNGAMPPGRRGRPIDLTPDEARALIDAVFRGYGLDPGRLTDPYGWRHLSLGSANGMAGVVEWQPGDHYLVVLAPVLEIQVDPALLTPLYQLLLEWNHDGTLSARFSICDNIVYVSLMRPIRGLDAEEVDDALRTVMVIADSYEKRLQMVLDMIIGTAPLSLAELPNIKVTPKEAQAIGAILSYCDPHGQDIFRYLMERWQKVGYVVDPGTSGIGLKIPIGSKLYGLASLRPGVGERRQLLILGWEGLRRQQVFPLEAIDSYQSAVAGIAEIKATESTAHVEITEAFSRDSAKALLRAMRALAASAQPKQDTGEEKPEWAPDLPKMDIKVGEKTLAGIQETLLGCDPRVQSLYAILIEGWNQAGESVQCSRPGRIYLTFKTREHDFGKYGAQSHQFSLAVLAAPKGQRGPSIEFAWNLAAGDYAYLDYVPDQVARFEAAVSNLPGFQQKGTVTRLVIDEAFQSEHAEAVLEAMLALRAAGGEA